VAQDVIELNGKRYDAVTGAYLGKSSVIPHHILHGGSGKVIDGFVRPSRPEPKSEHRPAPAHHAAPKAVHHAAPTMEPTKRHHREHAHPKHLKAHTPERAQTLMRRAVHKPEFSLKPVIKLQAPAEVMAKPTSALMHKRSVYSIDPVRQERAAATGQHQAVRHFHPPHREPALHTVAAHVPVIAVRPAPSKAAKAHAHPKKHHDVFESAIARATSHEQPVRHPRNHRVRRRLINSLAIVGAFLVIGGFIGYLNLPTLKLKVASMQVGFSASMPSYAPTGYALQDIKHTGGTIGLSFRSGASHYTITQQASDWNSQTLLDNTLALRGEYRTVEKNGQTVYIYEGTNAAWVNGGVRYDLNGNAELSKDDIARIATSL
jgi:hypothetical protein